METPITQEDATRLLVLWLRNPDHGQFSSYGYDAYLSRLAEAHLERRGTQRAEMDGKLRAMMPMLYAAAWDLCRRGILRPGIARYGAQATVEGGSGEGYSITPFGKTWLSESDHDAFVPTEPERFGEMLARYRDRFGEGFHERGQQAIRCYGAHAYLACCAMCGAASESILLATAIAKTGDEARVLRDYSGASGRGRVEKLVLGQAKDALRNEYQRCVSLIKYWRDEAAHGRSSGIKDHEAYTSLALLLRLAAFANDHWDDLVI